MFTRFDALTHRHAGFKVHVVTEAFLADVPVDCEFYDTFSDLLSAFLVEEGEELQYGRQRQGKIPNFKFLLSTPEGPTSRLAELKFINACKMWYKPGEKGQGMER